MLTVEKQMQRIRLAVDGQPLHSFEGETKS